MERAIADSIDIEHTTFNTTDPRALVRYFIIGHPDCTADDIARLCSQYGIGIDDAFPSIAEAWYQRHVAEAAR